MPLSVIVAGPNGSGKTTLVQSGALAPAFALPALSINADDIARSLAGDRQPNPEEACAPRKSPMRDWMRPSLRDRMCSSKQFSHPTKFKQRMLTAKQAGFEFMLVYVTVRLGMVNVDRATERVKLGAHPVPVDRILARR
jgi:predicted ABC-type ATPase